LNLAGRALLEKEGELLLYEKGFRLRGKGAHDHGEMVHFSDVRDFSPRGETFVVNTYMKEQFEILEVGGLFDQFIKDMYRVRNAYLIDALFLKQGKFRCEFEAYFERSNASERDLGKGRCRVQLYDESIVVIPGEGDAFCLPFHFMQQQDFDDDEYLFKVTMDNGIIVQMSQFGNSYEEFQEHFYGAMSAMYQAVIDQLEYQFIDTPKEKIVKLAHLMRGGKAVRLKEIAKIDKELAKNVEACVFKDDMFLLSVENLRAKVDDEHLFIGLSVADGKKEIYKFVAVFAVPSDNLIACTFGCYEKDIRKVQDTYFFRIIMDRGVAEDFVNEKVLEINQANLLLHYVPDPIYKDKRELKNSPYKLAIRRLSFLRILRSSFVARCPSILPELFSRNLARVLEKTKVAVPEPVSVE
jgi:hypothetical protein